MIVEQIMRKDFFTIGPKDKLRDALKIINQHKVRHLIVTNNLNHVVGIVSDRDIRDAAPSILEDKQNEKVLDYEIEMIMSRPVMTVHPLDFIEDIASIFYDHEIGCVPVTNGNELIGVVTEKDLLYTLIQITGIREQSSQIEIKVPNKIGILPDITKVVSDRNTNISFRIYIPI